MSGCGAVETFEHEVQVEAGEAGQSVAGAQVRAEVGVRNVYEATTDDQGVARLALDSRHLGSWAKVIIEADGYQRQSILVKLEQDSPPSVVKLLRPGEASPATQVPAATLTPAASNVCVLRIRLPLASSALRFFLHPRVVTRLLALKAGGQQRGLRFFRMLDRGNLPLRQRVNDVAQHYVGFADMEGIAGGHGNAKVAHGSHPAGGFARQADRRRAGHG